jgi:hypothetical protein
MKPSIGRIICVFADPRWNNGADFAPAIITRVWNEDTPVTVNVRVLHDGPPERPANRLDWLTSIPLYDTREDAEAAHAKLCKEFAAAGASPLEGAPHRAWWPPRVEREPGDRPAGY